MIEMVGGPILAIAPHPDDETIGAGGALLRAARAGLATHWLIVTDMDPAHGWPAEKIARREKEIAEITRRLGFSGTHRLGLPSARLETLPLGDVVGAIAKVVKAVEPACIMLPHRGDAHSDHDVVWKAGAACAKWFRYPSVRWVMSYETLSETDAGLDPVRRFEPDLFVDVSATLSDKLEACGVFADELGAFPFPRSLEAIEALARVRGAASGFAAAESFMLHRARG